MIEFIRGDTQPLKFQITKLNETSKEYESVTPTEIDTLTLTCRLLNTKSSPIIFQKTKEDFEYDEEYYHIAIEPEDTRELEYGEYNFDIECKMNDGYIKTLKSQFKITEEDTIYVGE